MLSEAIRHNCDIIYLSLPSTGNSIEAIQALIHTGTQPTSLPQGEGDKREEGEVDPEKDNVRREKLMDGCGGTGTYMHWRMCASDI